MLQSHMHFSGVLITLDYKLKWAVYLQILQGNLHIGDMTHFPLYCPRVVILGADRLFF